MLCVYKAFGGDGEAKIQQDNVGSPHYMSPEALTGAWIELTPKADVYSFGIVLYEMFARTMPFELLRPIEIIQLVAYGNGRPEIPATGWPRMLARLIRCCWAAGPEQRPTMEQVLHVLSHPPNVLLDGLDPVAYRDRLQKRLADAPLPKADASTLLSAAAAAPASSTASPTAATQANASATQPSQPAPSPPEEPHDAPSVAARGSPRLPPALRRLHTRNRRSMSEPMRFVDLGAGAVSDEVVSESVAMLRSDDYSVCQEGMVRLRELATDGAGRNAIVRLSGHGVLVQTMRESAACLDDPDGGDAAVALLEVAATAVARLCATEAVASALHAAGVTEALAPLLQHGSLPLRLAAVRALAALAEAVPASHEALWKAPILNALRSMCVAPSGQPEAETETCLQAATCLAAITASPGSHRILCVGNGLDCLTGMLDSGVPGVRMRAAVALANLSRTRATHAALFQSGAPLSLIKLLSSNADVLRRHALLAIIAIAGDDTYHDTLVFAGLLPPLIALLRSPMMPTRALAAQAIATLALSPSTARALIALNCVELLTKCANLSDSPHSPRPPSSDDASAASAGSADGAGRGSPGKSARRWSRSSGDGGYDDEGGSAIGALHDHALAALRSLSRIDPSIMPPAAGSRA